MMPRPPLGFLVLLETYSHSCRVADLQHTAHDLRLAGFLLPTAPQDPNSKEFVAPEDCRFGFISLAHGLGPVMVIHESSKPRSCTIGVPSVRSIPMNPNKKFVRSIQAS